MSIHKFIETCKQVNIELKDYQKEGLLWCLKNEIKGVKIDNALVKGGILAYEMGLGKTLLMIGSIASNAMKKTLIVLPPILIEQWYNEIERITGHKAIVYYRPKMKKITITELTENPIIIISYKNLVSKNNINYLLNRPLWDRVIFDEAHYLRNHKTKLYYYARELRSKIKWLVTGTPAQHYTKDFYNLCNILDITTIYCKQNPTELYRFVLKKTKEEAGIVLPAVDTHIKNISWNNEYQAKLSEELHSILIKDYTPSKNEKVLTAYTDMYEKKLPLYTKIRQLCSCPTNMKESLNKLVDSGQLADTDYKGSLNGNPKLENIVKLIKKNMSNDRGKIVFCQFKTELNYLETELKQLGMSVGRIDGSVSKKNRELIIKNNNLVLLLQINCCCDGLNLQDAYSEVYFVSPHWNKATEEQAIARCHRIGQKNPVTVYRFNMTSFIKTMPLCEDEQDCIVEDDQPIQLDLDSMDTYVTKMQHSKLIKIMSIFEPNDL